MPALKVSPAQRADLRSEAHALKPVVIVGAEGLTEAVLTEIEVHLGAHQLIKIRVFGDDREARIAMYDEIADRLHAAQVQHIGKLLVIWRPEGTVAPAKSVKNPGSKRTALPSAREAAGEPSTKGAAPRIVKAVKITRDAPAVRKPKKQKLLVRGNERVTAGGNVKRAKKRQTSAKRQHQTSK
jgi:putative YhbY family RNA-binding protein